MKNNPGRHAVLNLMVLPGLGSLLAGRKLAGLGQLILVLAGSVLLLVWFFKELAQYYGLMFADVQPQEVGWIGKCGAGLFAASWLWAAVTSFSLFYKTKPPESFEKTNMGNTKSSETQIVAALAALPEWQRNGGVISRTFQFKDFPAAMKFVNDVSELAEQAQHHPDVDIRWNKVTLAFTTHDAGGLTGKDFALAGECDALAAQ